MSAMNQLRCKVVIVGAGPAGLFCADELLDGGVKDIILIDSGKAMPERECPATRTCDCDVCDILEGEGGSGGFSDGKKTYSLTRGTQMEDLFDPSYEPVLYDIDRKILQHITGEGLAYKGASDVDENPEVFRGTPFEFSSYPLRHIGSDGVREFICRFADDLRSRGLRTIYNFEAEDLSGGRDCVTGIMGNHDGEPTWIEAETVILATGLQGIPWVEAILGRHNFGTGPAGIGLRLEAPDFILEPLFSQFYDFKLVYQHGPYTLRSFCCNRQGFITNENHRTLHVRNVNGHSYLSPDQKSKSSNFAIIAKVSRETTAFPQEFVRAIARGVNSLAEGGTVIQRVPDFIQEMGTTRMSPENLHTRTNYQALAGGHIGAAMPKDLYEAFRGFLEELDKVLEGTLIESGALLYGPEVKYYGYRAPVDMTTFRSTQLGGLYVIGNATGYLDSFVSAALTGVIAARDITKEEE